MIPVRYLKLGLPDVYLSKRLLSVLQFLDFISFNIFCTLSKLIILFKVSCDAVASKINKKI